MLLSYFNILTKQSYVPLYGYTPFGRGLIVYSLTLIASKGMLARVPTVTAAAVAHNLFKEWGPMK